MALMSAKETHKMACYLCAKAKPYHALILVLAWFDLADLGEAIIAASGRGVGVMVLADHKNTIGGPARDQLQRLRALRAAGVAVMLTSGIDAHTEYAAVGRTGAGQGILHAKLFRMGDYLIVGSTNWTTSSKCNVEQSALLELSPEGVREFDRRIELMVGRSTPLTLEIEEAAILKKAEAKARKDAQKHSRSSSPHRSFRMTSKRSPSSPPK